jgi:oligopeptide/dipeptide ABC transporter ATP-binding protein
MSRFAGCLYYPRCDAAENICLEYEPELKDTGNGHQVACHLIKFN